ncbi:MAG TPA: LysE family translocator [Casimicrobiaceae bacterium]|nr:LysE family translocator [Casimicrobiaceae bacterium]
MIDVSWPIFVTASLVLIATPGQDMILVMSRSIAQGPAAGIATAAGVSVGLIGHTVLATLGLGAILRASEWLFVALKLVGAAYLLYLGIGLLLSRHDDLGLSMSGKRSPARLFIDGAISNVTNPKIAIFFFAFLPQFVSPSATHPTLSILALGLAFAALTFLLKAPIGLFAGTLSSWLRARPAVLRWLFRSSGAILVGLSVRLALERRQ